MNSRAPSDVDAGMPHLVETLRETATREAIDAALEQCGGNRVAARALLKMSKTTFFRLLASFPDIAERYPTRAGRKKAAPEAAPRRAPPPMKVRAAIQTRFEAFHSAHPEVYEELVKVARRQFRGTGHIGIGCCWEVLRWRLQSRRGKKLKLDNTWRSRYARMIQAREPELAGAFRTRRLRS